MSANVTFSKRRMDLTFDFRDLAAPFMGIGDNLLAEAGGILLDETGDPLLDETGSAHGVAGVNTGLHYSPRRLDLSFDVRK